MRDFTYKTLIKTNFRAGAAIAFAANTYVENGIDGIGRHVTSGTADLRLYVDNAQAVTTLNT